MAFAITCPAFANDQSELSKVQKAISATQIQIKNTSTAQKQIGVSLEKTHTELSNAQTQLILLDKQQHLSLQRLTKLQNQLDQTQTEINATQTQIARLLNAHYRNQQPNSVNILLNRSHIEQKGRILQYLRYLNRANEQVINQLQQQRQQLIRQQQDLTTQQKQLAILKTRQQTLVTQLSHAHQIKLQQSTELEKQLFHQNQKLQKLKADEKRMNALLSRLATTKEKQKIKQQKIAIHKLSEKKTPQTAPASTSSLTAEDLKLKADDHEVHVTGAFVSQQGQLYRPVNAPVTHHFGTSRTEGGTWKGLFFATTPTTVRSIAQGTVIYAAPLKGYGNTIIIDHGDGYLSIYTGLADIFVQSAQTIAAGAGIGKSGNLPDRENGLYFEIRYHNQPMNPLSWIN
ncbi:peptidoglycan DD-metalloendopeptidase family protein [Neisseriaceae bacterium ESL0693]|nr:peptidoglycan DD-metalloendopeptidase family protein [Neisseriaceae bacterium ESL0693]